MHYIYQAYTREINGSVHYFVKKFLHFPEFQQVADIQEGFGMHQDFPSACRIAGIEDPGMIRQIFEQVNNNMVPAKIIDITTVSILPDIQSHAV